MSSLLGPCYSESQTFWAVAILNAVDGRLVGGLKRSSPFLFLLTGGNPQALGGIPFLPGITFHVNFIP